MQASGDNQNHGNVKIGQNTKKYTGGLRRVVVTQTLPENKNGKKNNCINISNNKQGKFHTR